MEISDQDLRAMVRESLARVRRTPHPPLEDGPSGGAIDLLHASHLRLPLRRGDDGDGACLIEPAVRCTHCGYCQSYGH